MGIRPNLQTAAITDSKLSSSTSNQKNWPLAPIADGFSAAAKSYHQHNQLQKISANHLLSKMPITGTILDIGAGPGTNFNNGSSKTHCGDNLKIIALDIAMGMLKELHHHYSHYQRICADAMQLPLLANSLDGVYSNLAMQWCTSLPTAIKETYRVLRTEGECHISLIVNGSLNELTQLGLQKNTFATEREIVQAFNVCNWRSLSIKIMPITVYFNDLKSLLYSLKGIGASTKTANNHSTTTPTSAPNQAKQGLKGRAYWTKLCLHAQQLAEPKGLPLSYQIAIIRGQK